MAGKVGRPRTFTSNEAHERDKARDAARYQRQKAQEAEKSKKRWRAIKADPSRLAAQRAAVAESGRQTRREVIEHYGGRCTCCGTDFYPHLCLDHVNGGGGAERRAGKGTKIYPRLKREGYPPGFQVLCWNCNSAKHYYGSCACGEVA